MESSHTPVVSPPPVGTVFPSDVLLSVLTPPLLIGIIGLRSLTDALHQVGLASEELFRGDRLPTLTLGTPPQED